MLASTKLKLTLLFLALSADILGDYVRGEGLMRLESGSLDYLELLIVINPLILQFAFQVLANLEVSCLLLKYLLYKYLINVLKVQLICLALVGLYLVRL